MTRSEEIVRFIANLLPLYTHEIPDNVCFARSLTDGTLIKPIKFDDLDDNEQDKVLVCWQGDENRTSVVQGDFFVTPILERYVRLHGVGHDEEAVAYELHFMANHYTFKTGGRLYLPQLPEPSHPLIRQTKKVLKFGQGTLITLFTKNIGL